MRREAKGLNGAGAQLMLRRDPEAHAFGAMVQVASRCGVVRRLEETEPDGEINFESTILPVPANAWMRARRAFGSHGNTFAAISLERAL